MGAQCRRLSDAEGRRIEHDPEKWKPVFRKDHAPNKTLDERSSRKGETFMPRISGAQRGSGVQAVVFALHTLEYIAQHQGSVGVTELARAFETTKSRMYRHLQTLMTAGYLVRDPQTERYRVSARLVALGQAVSEGFEFARAARDVTRELRDKLGHAAVLSQTEDDGIRIVLLVPSKSSVEIAVKPGSVLAFHASAQGKIALAFGDPSLSERVLAGELPMQTVYTIGDPAKLKAEIDLTRKRGWAAAPNESVIGLNALAAPAFDALGHYAGAIAIVDTMQFIPENPSVEQVRELTEAAAQISRNLGYRASQPVYADTNARMKAAGGAG
jgi:DNA-binding IclR family transcriptional regulator